MHGGGIGFARAVFGAPVAGKQVAQVVAGEEMLDAGAVVVADHGADHPGGVKLLQ